jgi:uncharacterized cupredoxin-like copper-binding protein
MYRLLWLWIALFVCHETAFAQRSQPDTTIILKAIAGLQYDQPRLVVRPNRQVRLILQNYDDMAHNLVVTRPNARLRVVEAALRMGADGAKNHYIPKLPDVLAHTETVEPDAIDTLTFTLDEGSYPFVCTYPGHGSLMYGVIHVTRTPKNLPPPDADPNLPKRPGATETHAHHATAPSGHPYALKLPALYRTFMPNAGPAAIAVGLPNDLSYCWDAGTCQLRYAWTGGFVDMNDQWDGKGQKLTKIVGDIFYQNPTGSKPDAFPLQPATGKAEVRYRGYQLQNRFPAFQYSVGLVQVRELLTAATAGRGLQRQFSLTGNRESLIYQADMQPGVECRATLNGKPARLTNGKLTIPANTKQFTITMLVP